MGSGDRRRATRGRVEAGLHPGPGQSRLRAGAQGRQTGAMTPTIALVIPAYRPPPLLPALVRDIAALDEPRIFQSIVVVDDGSEPRFAQTFADAASQPRVAIVRREVNGGQGAALKTGIGHALAQFPDL